MDRTIDLLFQAAYGNLFTDINMGAATEPWGWVARGQVRRTRAFWGLACGDSSHCGA